jgi:hypothetical protein
MNLLMVGVGEGGVYTLRLPVFDFGFRWFSFIVTVLCRTLRDGRPCQLHDRESYTDFRDRLWGPVASSVHTVFCNPDGRRQCFVHYLAKL